MRPKMLIGRAVNWLRTNTFATLGLAALLIMLCWRLGSLPISLSQSEKLSVATSNLGAIFKSPLNAPYRLLQDLLLHINHSAFSARLASVIVALIFTTTFYYLLKSWFGKSIAVLSTIILVFTPYFIISARSATPAIMFFIPILAMAAYCAASRHPGDRLPILFLIVSTGLALYIPGLVWLILIMGIYRFSKLRDMAFQADLNAKYYLILGLLLLVILLPLIVGLVTHPAVVKQWLLIPNIFPGLGGIVKSWLWALSAFFLQARAHQDLIIAKLPLLNAAQIGLLVFGGYVMWTRLRLELIAIIGSCLIIALLSGLNNDYGVLALALPLLTIMMGMGLRYLFIEWRHIFPLNPIAKAFAIGLMSVLVLSHVLFGIRYSLVAWPATVAAKHSNVLK